MKVDELENDMKIIMKPIEKLSSKLKSKILVLINDYEKTKIVFQVLPISGIFPDLDIMEVQFDIQQTHSHSTGLPVFVKSRNKVRQENIPVKTATIKKIDSTRGRPSTLVSIMPITRATNENLPIYGISSSLSIALKDDKNFLVA